MNLFLVIQGSVLWTKNINEYITVNSLWIGLILLLLLVIITLSLFFILKYARTMKSRWKQSLLIAQKLQPDNDLEQNMSDI